jgi:hypothetical protein
VTKATRVARKETLPEINVAMKSAGDAVGYAEGTDLSESGTCRDGGM